MSVSTNSTVFMASVAVLALAAGATVLPPKETRSEDSPPPLTQIAEAESISLSPTVALSDLEAARQAVAERQYSLARLHLERLLRYEPDNAQAILLFLEAVRQEIPTLVKSEHFELAEQHVQLGRDLVKAFADISFQEVSNSVSLTDLDEAERSEVQLTEMLQNVVALWAKHKLELGEQLANESDRWFRNDRDKVRDGLRQLRAVQAVFEYLDPDQRGEYFRVIGLLKSYVSDSEWDSLVAEAGFISSAPMESEVNL